MFYKKWYALTIWDAQVVPGRKKVENHWTKMEKRGAVQKIDARDKVRWSTIERWTTCGANREKGVFADHKFYYLLTTVLQTFDW